MHKSVPATGLTSVDQRHPGWRESRPTLGVTGETHQFQPPVPAFADLVGTIERHLLQGLRHGYLLHVSPK
jgi:hypothetical protein